MRKERNITQEQLADMMNMSRQGISHWETGRTEPDMENLKKLSNLPDYSFKPDTTLPPAMTAETETARNFRRKRTVCRRMNPPLPPLTLTTGTNHMNTTHVVCRMIGTDDNGHTLSFDGTIHLGEIPTPTKEPVTE